VLARSLWSYPFVDWMCVPAKMAAAVTTISRRETQNRRERLSGSRGGTNRAQQLTHFLDAMKRYGA
jgi:hypothetical protein